MTQQRYVALYGENPSLHLSCGDDCPVERINWHEAAYACNELSLGEQLDYCYDCFMTEGGIKCMTAGAYKDGSAIYSCPGYRLPTEAEWDRAYRGHPAATTAYYNRTIQTPCESGSGPQAEQIGWYEENSAGAPHPVASKQPNNLGLFDLAGNLWEWTHDCYQAELGADDQVDPVIDVPICHRRVIRGGGFASDRPALRAAERRVEDAIAPSPYIGFRCARSILH